MNFINEYALLVAVSLPVAVIVGMQVFLFVSGERSTGLLPGFNRYPSIEFGNAAGAIVPQPVVSEVATFDTAVSSSNDELERQAA